MLKSLKLQNFRCFPNFELQKLGQINLLVGANNSGKSSILEAIQLLCSPSIPETLLEVMKHRGEYLRAEENDQGQLNIRHLFHGHTIDIDSKISLIGKRELSDDKLEIYFRENQPKNEPNLNQVDAQDVVIVFAKQELGENRQQLQISLIPDPYQIEFRLSNDAGLLISDLTRKYGIRRTLRKLAETLPVNLKFITSSSLTPEKMIELFDQIVLTPNESLVIKAMQSIEPDLEKIASVSVSGKYQGVRDGFMVRLADSDQRIPIGSMGDGIWRILGLALGIVNAQNGILLVDEIDTGLHFTALSDMWKMLWTAAKELNVQVFATTHNSDCWTSLASIANRENPSEEGITIHRIERNKPTSVIFDERQIAIACERGIEVR